MINPNPYHLETWDLKQYISTFERTFNNYVGYVFKFPNGFGASVVTNAEIYPNWVVVQFFIKDEKCSTSKPQHMESEDDVLVYLNELFEKDGV